MKFVKVSSPQNRWMFRGGRNPSIHPVLHAQRRTKTQRNQILPQPEFDEPAHNKIHLLNEKIYTTAELGVSSQNRPIKYRHKTHL
jgi:hypothetical protein